MSACDVRVRGVVQGVGFRPFVLRLARANTLTGWVLNGVTGVEIHLEGGETAMNSFVRSLRVDAPPSASVTTIDVETTEPIGFTDFTIRESEHTGAPTTRISPDLPVCDDCVAELFDRNARRYLYPYINCATCGPRYSILLSLPYDRVRTTMKRWTLDEYCATQYSDPSDRRFHAQPIACPECGPHLHLRIGDETVTGDRASIAKAVELLNREGIVAVKGVGGYHLACDARSTKAVQALRERKYRKEKPFAVMVKSIDAARRLVDLSEESESLMLSTARPIVLAPALVQLPGVAPDNQELGVMLPYAPLHYLLFAAGAPEALVLTSANRSSEPIAYRDDDALRNISGIADAFLIGERPIARRVDDSVVRVGSFGPLILRRSRGYAPSVVATIPSQTPILAVGADLKNTVTLVVKGEALVSQHIGDLEQFECLEAFRETIDDLISMYELDWQDVVVAHDAHPQYQSTMNALALPARRFVTVQHHRSHIASVLAEREAWEERVLGVSFDGTGYGDDGSIWGGEIFAGSITHGFDRVAHLRPSAIPGGDAAARCPLQSAAGYLAEIGGLGNLDSEPFLFPRRYQQSIELARRGMRTFTSTSMGRLFDAAAALLGYTRNVTYEGQAAIWVEHLARTAGSTDAYPFPLEGSLLDFRPLLTALTEDRVRGRAPEQCARAFQRGVALGLCSAILTLCEAHRLSKVVLSGGVFQNELLLEDIRSRLEGGPLAIWTNHSVPPNDGGISLGQAALAAFGGTCTNSQ